MTLAQTERLVTLRQAVIVLELHNIYNIEPVRRLPRRGIGKKRPAPLSPAADVSSPPRSTMRVQISSDLCTIMHVELPNGNFANYDDEAISTALGRLACRGVGESGGGD